MKKVIYILLLLVTLGSIGVIAFLFFENKTIDKKIVETGQGGIIYINASNDLVRVELPFSGAVVGKEFSVIGEARGYWFFEASFPIVLLDKNNNILATAIAQAQPDPKTGQITREINWMTENFVPFRADLKVPSDYIGEATLVLHKDNPSGISEKDASISFPIVVEY